MSIAVLHAADLAGILSAILDELEQRLKHLPHSILQVLWKQAGCFSAAETTDKLPTKIH